MQALFANSVVLADEIEPRFFVFRANIKHLGAGGFVMLLDFIQPSIDFLSICHFFGQNFRSALLYLKIHIFLLIQFTNLVIILFNLIRDFRAS